MTSILENQIIAVNAAPNQTLEVYYQDEVDLQIDVALMYIKSGEKEIADYVENEVKPELDKSVLSAAQSASEALTSETAAKASETAALGSASSAAESESEAKASATDALESATNAANSSMAAASSATAAAASAAEAYGSETAAKASETAAASSAAAAEEWYQKMGSVYRVKGSVDNYASLPANPEIGDVYNLNDTGANYVWNGSEWDKLSETVDLTSYRTAADQDVIDAGKQPNLVSGVNIKTVNGENLLGGGNVNISGLPDGGNTGDVLMKTDSGAEWGGTTNHVVVDTLPETPLANTFYYIPEV